MPTVLRIGGFEVIIRLPPREHGPPHVHVFKAGGRVIINLPDAEQPRSVRKVVHMREPDIALAIRLVERHEEYLMSVWRRLHD